MRLVADENMLGLDALPASIDVRAVPGRSIDQEMLRDADALWVRSVTRVDEALVRDTPLRFVGSATAGLEHVDQLALAARGISFAAAPGANAMAVVEYVVAALAHLREPWERLARGGCLGIVGHGHVGRRLAAFARAMGWRHLVYDPPLAAQGKTGHGDVDLDAILSCNVISLHCSLHDTPPWPSRHLIDARALERLTRGQWLINASRGEVLDTGALRDCLSGGTAARFVLDVWEGEPAIDPSIVASPAVQLATPHIAGYSWDAKWKATHMLLEAMQVQGLAQAERGREPRAVGEPPVGWPAHARGAAELFGPVYDIGADDARLRMVLANPSAGERAEGFDRLRRNYPLRREVSRLLADPGEPGLKELGGEAGQVARALLVALSC
jgi:erythronate-4-phosphate dehydrogenase